MKPPEAVRAAYGLCELLAPDFVSGRLLGEPPHRRVRIVIRVLGARHLLQAVLTARAASMVVLTRARGVDRMFATVNAALAMVFGAGSSNDHLTRC